MSSIITLLNNSDYLKPSYIKQLFDKDNNGESQFGTVMIKGLVGTFQNIITIDDISIVCDGNIYNYKKIYEDLKINPQTDYDYEVIIHLYKEYGIETTLQLLDGIYAFVLIDNRIKSNHDLDARIYIARDPYGVKPLYIFQPNIYHPNFTFIKNIINNLFAFSSNKKVLQDIETELNHLYLYGSNNTKQQPYSDVNSKDSLYIIENIQPGTYSLFELEYKVLSLWKNIKYQVPFHSFIPGNILNNCFLSKSTTKYVLSRYITEAYTKRIEYYQKEVVFVIDTVNEPLETAIASSMFDKYTNKITNFYVQIKNNEDWSNVLKEVSKRYSNHVIFFNIGFDYLIKQKKSMGELEYHNYCQTYLKNMYIDRIQKIMDNNICGLEFDFPLLDTNFIHFFLTNFITQDIVSEVVTDMVSASIFL